MNPCRQLSKPGGACLDGVRLRLWDAATEMHLTQQLCSVEVTCCVHRDLKLLKSDCSLTCVLIVRPIDLRTKRLTEIIGSVHAWTNLCHWCSHRCVYGYGV